MITVWNCETLSKYSALYDVGEDFPCDEQLSPSKALRAAILRSRFAGIIVKTQQKTLLNHVFSFLFWLALISNFVSIFWVYDTQIQKRETDTDTTGNRDSVPSFSKSKTLIWNLLGVPFNLTIFIYFYSFYLEWFIHSFSFAK